MTNLPAVIFAGGRGVRLGESFGKIPKALVRINDKAIVEYVMEHLSKYGINEFFILTGYRSELIRQHFADLLLSDHMTIDFGKNKIDIKGKRKDWIVHIVDTGKDSSTQSRLFRIKHLLKNYENCIVTYADGISDVNIKELISFHVKHKFTATVTAVQVESKFGDLNILENQVSNFTEKGIDSNRWINGGFMILNQIGIAQLNDSEKMFEDDFLPKCAESLSLGAFKHYGFWKAMDTPKDHEEFESLASSRAQIFGEL